ncbi:hypothetical protein SEA_SLOOPYJOE_82 [Arthrobacter phage Sloopyjoe]|nr:hypothetical protein PBI_STARLORD_82 [Arthrobacter phage StarLord]WAB09498.1 hypothetical protein SEA_SLOOPYJOE_82 [Arthrobacter phage Sloopyjoe]WKW85800.1 hypothetical protein SEA_MRAARONIAN_82 [Arthrobacter phage MrAaronian]WNO27684.1 hypothetical protein SEA_DJUNGELSKOG_81 [Arthrobacter phage Djungelskog]
MPNAHVIFGTERLLRQYVEKQKVYGQYVLLATRPDTLQNIIDYPHDSAVKIIAVRYPAEIWKPSTHPCEGRVRETEAILKESKRLGADVEEIFMAVRP